MTPFNNCKKANICIFTTKTSLNEFMKAVENINSETRGHLHVEEILFAHEATRDNIRGFLAKLVKCNVLLLDIRSLMNQSIRDLIEAIHDYNGYVIPLVGAGPEIFKLVRLGRLNGSSMKMNKGSPGFDDETIRVDSIAKMLKIIEKVSSLLPLGVAKDTRNWIRLMKYWWIGGRENYENMLRLLMREYFGCKNLSIEPPKELAKPGSVYIPGIGFLEPRDARVHVDKEKQLVLVLMYAGMHLEQTRIVADALIPVLRSLGIEAVGVVGGANFDLVNNHVYIAKAVNGLGIKPFAIVNLQWFRIRGGPYGGDPSPVIDLLKKLNVLLFNGLIMYMRQISKWEKEDRGLSPIEVLAGVALPEADGSIEPIPSAGLLDDIARSLKPLEERIARKAARIYAWSSLRSKPKSARRIAFIVYNYPPDPHNIGSASYLNVFASLERIINALRDDGYKVPEVDKQVLLRSLKNSTSECLTKWSWKEYIKLYVSDVPPEQRTLVERIWGRPPSSGIICIPGIILDNIFIGIQPSRGVHENPEKIYHSKDLPPTHEYLAFYFWIRRVFGADAIVHVGTHGTLEFMPGKEVGLSANCFPDILIGNTPHIYIYHVTNPSEMTIAKRRSYAYIVTHMPPPYTRSGLYDELLELEELVHEYHEAKSLDPSRLRIIEQIALEKAQKLGINAESIEEIHEELYEIKTRVIPSGLHVFGTKWTRDQARIYITLLLRYDGDVPSLKRLIVEANGVDYYKALDNPSQIIRKGRRASDVLEEAEKIVEKFVELVISGKHREAINYVTRIGVNRKDVERIANYVNTIYNKIVSSDEIRGLIEVLNAHYIEPGVAGDPLRTPEALPTGRHGYAFDPRLVPSMAAYRRGAIVARDTLEKYRAKYGKYPETVAVVLWGFETAGTRGETIGQILEYLGVKLERRGPWAWDLKPIPVQELGHPRIDVVVTICGIFRDTFPHLIDMLNRAFQLVAGLNEPTNINYVRKHYLEMRTKGTGSNLSLLRIFGPKPGAYNTRLTELIETSTWADEDELAATYIADMGYAYSDAGHGIEAKNLFKELLAKVDMVTQIRYSNEYDIVDLDHYYEFLGGVAKAVEKTRGRKPQVLWADTTLEKPRVKTVEKAIVEALHTRLLNPRWIKAMLDHGYDGAREIAERIEYLLGLAATTNSVPNWAWDKIVERYIRDPVVRYRIARENPDALTEIARRLFEAARRGYWKTTRRELEEIEELISSIQDTEAPSS